MEPGAVGLSGISRLSLFAMREGKPGWIRGCQRAIVGV